MAALGTVPDLSASPTEPPVLTPYSAWPVWDHDEGVNPCVLREFWQVVVLLPGGDRAFTVTEGDRLRGPVSAALFAAPVFVDRVEPSRVSNEEGGQAVPALLFTVSR